MSYTTRKSKLPFVILKPVVAPPQLDRLFLCLGADDLREFFAGHDAHADYLAFDIETKGNRPFDPESQVVGFSLADVRGAGYWTAEHWPLFLALLERHSPRLVAHNVFFDGAYVMRDGKGLWPTWAFCTYGLYKYLATEGWPGQRWGLKDAQKQLLGWEETNERDLLEWLVRAGYTTATRKSIDDVKETDDWFEVQSPLEDSTWAKADKGEMWRAPPEILGKYCALDAQATYLLLTKVLLPALDRFHVLRDFHQEVFLTEVRILIEQELSGIAVDVEGLHAHADHLRKEIDVALHKFLEHPEVAPGIAEYNAEVLKEHDAKEPPRFNKEKRTPAEPPKYTKTGAVSQRWLAWQEKAQTHPEVSKRWTLWKDKRDALTTQNHFNAASGQQLSWLFYQHLGKPVMLTTDSGAPAVDGRAMGLWGEPGALLRKRSKLEKELGYVEAAAQYQRNGIIHPQFRVPGTLTGRLSGSGGLNMQQQPKTREYLQLLRARPGTVWVDFDYVALEPSVLTELSRDPSMLKVYGPAAKPNDIYIFVGSAIPGIKETFAACGYNPDAPTKESIARIKKEHKLLRNICKVLTLSAQYGAGPRKIHETLKLQGVVKTLEEVQLLHQSYWKLFAGIKEYERFLLKCWQRNDGWVLNGIGRPLAVHADLTKDLVNRVVQSTGHSIHAIGLSLLRPLLAKAFGQNFRWIIADFHDEAIIEVPEGEEETAIACFRQMERELNELLQPYVPVKMDPAVGKSLADFKVGD